MISNLQEFKKVATKLGNSIDQYDSHIMSFEYLVSPSNIGLRKRKRVKRVFNKVARIPSSSTDPRIFNSCGNIGEKSVKEVRFSMKSNLI